jgi:hypothetical protein
LLEEEVEASNCSNSESVPDSSTGDSYLSCTEDDGESKVEAGASVLNTTFTIVKNAENPENATSALSLTCVDDAMELSDSINEVDQNAVLEHSRNYVHANKDDSSNESLGECSMEDSVQDESGLLNEPPPEFVNSTADTQEILADEAQSGVEREDEEKVEQAEHGAAAVGSKDANELGQEECSDMEEEKEIRVADDEKNCFLMETCDNSSNEKVNCRCK